MGFFSIKTTKQKMPAGVGQSAFISTSSDGTQQYNGSAHNAAVHRAQDLERLAKKDAMRQSAIKANAAADKFDAERGQVVGHKDPSKPAAGANLIEFPRSRSPMWIGESGLATDDKYKFTGLNLSGDRFESVLVGVLDVGADWGENELLLSKKEKKKLNHPSDPIQLTESYLNKQNALLAQDGVFVRFRQGVHPVHQEYAILAIFPENQSQYDSWKLDMFR